MSGDWEKRRPVPLPLFCAVLPDGGEVRFEQGIEAVCGLRPGASVAPACAGRIRSGSQEAEIARAQQLVDAGAHFLVDCHAEFVAGATDAAAVG